MLCHAPGIIAFFCFMHERRNDNLNPKSSPKKWLLIGQIYGYGVQHGTYHFQRHQLLFVFVCVYFTITIAIAVRHTCYAMAFLWTFELNWSFKSHTAPSQHFTWQQDRLSKPTIPITNKNESELGGSNGYWISPPTHMTFLASTQGQ